MHMIEFSKSLNHFYHILFKFFNNFCENFVQSYIEVRVWFSFFLNSSNHKT